MQKAIELSQAYAPFNGLASFWKGYREHNQGKRDGESLSGVDQQAYDRGAQLATEVSRAA